MAHQIGSGATGAIVCSAAAAGQRLLGGPLEPGGIAVDAVVGLVLDLTGQIGAGMGQQWGAYVGRAGAGLLYPALARITDRAVAAATQE